MTKEELNIAIAEIERQCLAVGEAVRKENFALGLPLIYRHEGKIVRECPDGRILPAAPSDDDRWAP